MVSIVQAEFAWSVSYRGVRVTASSLALVVGEVQMGAREMP